jgi:hypothetical protein
MVSSRTPVYVLAIIMNPRGNVSLIHGTPYYDGTCDWAESLNYEGRPWGSMPPKAMQVDQCATDVLGKSVVSLM